MKIPDRSFLRFAGAEPVRQMRKEQRLAENAYVSGLTYEKPLDSPDRPSNIERRAQESLANLPDLDNPSKILSGISEFRKPVAEGEEEGVVKDSPDNPSTILKAIGEFTPPAEAPPPLPELDDPSAITKAIGEFKPPEPDAGPLPAEVDTPSKILSSLMEQRPEEYRAQAIEADTPMAILSSLAKQRPKEEALASLETDLPSAILASLGQQRPKDAPQDIVAADQPGAILASLGQPAPEPVPGPAPTLADIPFEQRPVPESDGGRIVNGEA